MLLRPKAQIYLFECIRRAGLCTIVSAAAASTTSAPAASGSSSLDDKKADRGALIHHLHYSAYVRLASSAISGVGVVAIADIPAAVNPFLAPNKHLLGREMMTCLSEREIRALPSAVAEQVLDFHAALDHPQDSSIRLRDADGEMLYGVCATGMVAMDMSWFVNHSEAPNLDFVRVEGQDFNVFHTSRAVLTGEELTYDYRVYAPDMYARIVDAEGGSIDARRERLEEKLRSTQAQADQLQAELRKLKSARC